MTITIFTLFPDFFSSQIATSMLQKAQEKGLVTIDIVNIRDYTTDKHKITDDRPFGGGAGMVMKIEPIDRALEDWREKHPDGTSYVVATSASGRIFTQVKAEEYSKIDNLAIICGHYEGIDQRVLDTLIDEEVRIGDYVLTGGEPASAVILDAVTRLVPGVLGNQSSTIGESHGSLGQGGVPQYTRPADYKGMTVPEVLLQGDHSAINDWRESHRRKIED